MSCCNGTPSDTKVESTLDDVKEYYGKIVKTTSDLQTGVCQLGGPVMFKKFFKDVHEEIRDKYYGCGLVIPDLVTDCRVLDLGSGAGLDCYVLSKLVGVKGHVTGIDMTDEQLEVAQKYVDYHTKLYGYDSPNINFVKGYIEKLKDAGIAQGYYDIIVSNCVVNLSPDKRAVLTEAYNALKEGGELYFSDIYSDRQVPEEVRRHKVLWGECVSGALWWEDLHTIATEVGFSAPRLVTASYFDITKPELKEVLGDLRFVSVTYRLFKLPKTQSSLSQVTYKGSIPDCAKQFDLDHKHAFKTGSPVKADEVVTTTLKSSRFASHFDFEDLPAREEASNANAMDDNPFTVATAAPGGCCN